MRAALASTATALAGGVVAAQYVGSGLYGSYAAASLAPYACAVLGVLFWTRTPRGGRVG